MAKGDDLPSGLAAPARRALASAGIANLDDLTTRKASDVAALHGMGLRAMDALEKELRERNLDFAPSTLEG